MNNGLWGNSSKILPDKEVVSLWPSDECLKNVILIIE